MSGVQAAAAVGAVLVLVATIRLPQVWRTAPGAEWRPGPGLERLFGSPRGAFGALPTLVVAAWGLVAAPFLPGVAAVVAGAWFVAWAAVAVLAGRTGRPRRLVPPAARSTSRPAAR